MTFAIFARSEMVISPGWAQVLATVLVCVFTGIFGGLLVYLAQLVWPDWRGFPNLETAFMDICRRVGGVFLFNAMGTILILAAFGSALTGGLGAARLLFGMGRDNVLPRRVFAHLSPGSSTPTYNILIIGGLSFLGAVVLNHIGNAYEHAGELLNFGAFLAFMGVNVATFWQFAVVSRTGRKRVFANVILPLSGFAFCALIWWNLNPLAKTIGGIWFAVGLGYLALTTSGFRRAPAMIDFSES